MADRHFTIQTAPRGTNTIKRTAPTNVVRDHIQARLTGTSLSIGVTVTTILERRQSVFRRLSMSLGSRKSSMLPLSNQSRPNTYRMESDNEYGFRPHHVQPKVLEVLMNRLKDKT